MQSKDNAASLCFNKDDFTGSHFTVDMFVSECRKHASLEEMRDDLSIYHKILCSAMIELINKDYADFVNLSSNLVGLDKSLKCLSTPLLKLKDEVNVVKSSLDVTLETARTKFSERTTTHNSKVAAHHILLVLEGLENTEDLDGLSDKSDAVQLEILDRVAFAFNLLRFHMNKVLDLQPVKSKQGAVDKVSKNIEQHLEQIFVRSLKNRDVQSLNKVLKIYSVISKEREIEAYFRVKFVRPFMNNCINQANITKYGLGKIYNDILEFISNSCGDILSITKGTQKSSPIESISGYDFLVNAVWPEIMECFGFPIANVYLYSPGDPKQFHLNYTASINFLDNFEQCCKVQTSVRRLRDDTSYKEFIQKWNLDLYFQIKFQEIASEFEGSLFETSTDNGEEHSKFYILNSTSSISNCIHQCWSDDVYLAPLKGSFWRLTLQLFARYTEWASAYLKVEDPIPIAMLMRDVNVLVSETITFFDQKIKPKMDRENHVSISAAFDESFRSLSSILPSAAKVVIEILFSKSSVHLKLINDIPRLYRRTNRELPTKPSGYVSMVFNPVEEFLKDTRDVLPSKWGKHYQLEVTKGVLEQCLSLVRDVLTSIKKMGDSLKILKRARDKPTGQVSDGSVTDDDKIRRQLTIDVGKLEEIVLRSGLQKSDLPNLAELKDLVTSAERSTVSFSKS